MTLHRSRRFLAALALAAGGFTLASSASAATSRYRLVWRDDPATTMTVGWQQLSGDGATVHYDTVDHGTDADAYAFSHGVDQSAVQTTPGLLGASSATLQHRFARLEGLTPDTAYYFVVRDGDGTSQRFWFKTAPATRQPFTFIAGGDSRTNRGPRQNANRVVAKLRPLFVAFGGDYTDAFGGLWQVEGEWEEWLDDWQLTISADGRMTPILAARGNHDSANVMTAVFDVPQADAYFRTDIAGGLLSLFTLNSEIAENGAQLTWLRSALPGARCSSFRMAQYHKPMRPHEGGKSEGDGEYDAWAKLFSDEGMDLVVECDSHTVKRTFPVKPDALGDEGFSRDDARGTVYIGEGCWGAPLRPNDDPKTWTAASGSFNQLSWVHAYDDRMEIRTILTDDVDAFDPVRDADPFALPANLPVWKAASGEVTTLRARSLDPGCATGTQEQTATVPFGSRWRFEDTDTDLGDAWTAVDYDDGAWFEASAQLGFGDGDEVSEVLNPSPNQPSVYFRHGFDLDLKGGYLTAGTLDVLFDDGIIVYINGTEVYRNNVSGAAHGDWSSGKSDDNERASTTLSAFELGLFQEGKNVIAAVVKQDDGFPESSDLSFDLALNVSYRPAPPPPGEMTAAGAGAGGMTSGGAPSGGEGASGGDAATGGDGASTGGQASGAVDPPGDRPTDDGPAGSGVTNDGGGCGCRTRPAAPAGWPLAGLLALGAVLAWRRRRG